MKEYDAIIIGGGAGLKIARPAANLGYKIAVIEKDSLGGTCLNRGCIPSKMLIHPADVITDFLEAKRYGIELNGHLKIDVPKLVSRVTQTVDEESKSIEPLLQNHPNIDFFKANAKFISHRTIEVMGEKIAASKIFIASGARPNIPQIPGLNDTPFITSTQLLRLEQLPQKIIILGGGYIACELGHYLKAMGVEVQFVIRSSFLKELDDDLQKHFEAIFKKRFKVTQMHPHEIEYKNKQFFVYGDQKVLTSDALLVATGVTPNSDHLGLNTAGIKLSNQGFIEVNDHLETNQKGVYAFGDIIGRYMFRHSANFEGEYLLRSHFEKPSEQIPICYPPIPYGVFTYPQIGGVGKSERALKEENRPYIVGLNHYQNSAMGMALFKNEGMVKLLFDSKSLKLLGGHIVGEHATDLIHMVIAYMNMNATLKDLLNTVYIHPALSENIRNAARNAKKNVEELRA